MTSLVTGEAVALDLRPARLPSRALALTLDLVIEFALLIVGIPLLSIGLSRIDDSLRGALVIGVLVLVLIGYPVIWETASRGRSVGKLALGLRVVREDGGPVRFRHALTRALAGFFVDFGVLGMFGAVALITSLASRRGARLGDLLAGTTVIRERVPAVRGAALTMPPQLASWATGLHLAGIPDDLALAARQYLNRFSQLSPQASLAMGTRLANEVSRYVGQPPPPPNTPPQAYLAAVLTERRDREQARINGAVQPASPGRPPEQNWAAWPPTATRLDPPRPASTDQSAVTSRPEPEPPETPAAPGGFVPPG